MENILIQKAEILRHLIEKGHLCLPVFVRFKLREKYYTLPVDGISFDDQQLKIVSDSTILILDWDKLEDIVVFRDSGNKPLFLNDFDHKVNSA